MVRNPEFFIVADIVLFTKINDEPHVLLVERGTPPFLGQWALPGGHVESEERIRDAAVRELSEETHVEDVELSLLGVYDEPDRDPRGRYISVAYYAVLPHPVTPRGGDDAVSAQWVPVQDANKLAFDHEKILMDAVKKITLA